MRAMVNSSVRLYSSLTGPARSHGKNRSERLRHYFLLIAEPPTDARLDHVDIAYRNVERKRQHAPAVVRNLGARAHDQPVESSSKKQIVTCGSRQVCC